MTKVWAPRLSSPARVLSTVSFRVRDLLSPLRDPGEWCVVDFFVFVFLGLSKPLGLPELVLPELD
jgi:hypothetical protein